MPLLASYGRPVAATHRIEARTLNHHEVRVVLADWSSGKDSDCWPVRETRLTDDFARITGEPSLLAFNGRYGLLGYHVLHDAEMQRRQETWQGDPIAWALAHARVAAGILGIVDMIDRVRRDKLELNKRTIPNLLRVFSIEFGKMGLKALFEGRPRRFVGFEWSDPDSLVDPGRTPLRNRFSSRWGNDPIGTTYHVLSWVLNQYVRRIRPELASLDYAARFFGMKKAGPPRFGPELRWDALLQVIYWQLAESVGGAFRQCPRCGRVFPMNAGKQEFCSLRCGNAARQQRRRDKKKKTPQKRKRRAQRRKHSRSRR
jgi:hypothetical protein